MSVNWGAVLTFLSSLAIVTPIIKYLFLPSYRIHLRRSSYIEKRDLLEKYYNETYLKKEEKNKFILQADTNILLSDDKFAYQTIFHILDSQFQYFYRIINNLKYCTLFIKEVKTNNDYSLVCKYSKKQLRIFFNVVLAIYIFIGLVWFLTNLYTLLKTGKWLNNSILDILVLIGALLTVPASKAKATLKLSKILSINFKDS